MCDRGPVGDRRHEVLGTLSLTDEDLWGRAQIHPEPVGPRREQGAFPHLRRADGDRRLAALCAAELVERHLSHLGGERVLAGRGGGRGIGRAERLLQPAKRLAQLELAEGLAQLRAVGRGRHVAVKVELDRDVALGRRELL